jgi:predicted GNAT family acetyltransferase
MHVLDNPAWSALTTRQADVAVGGSLAKRFLPHLAPIAGVARRNKEALDELAALVPEDDWLSLPATFDNLEPFIPPVLRVTLKRALVQMVCEHRIGEPDVGIDFSVLGEGDIPAMLALTALTHPGPFKSHTYTLGTYLGVRVDGQLVAMAGQRMYVPGYREISAVCTHPLFEGRGYARALVARLVAKTFDEDAVPFLHVEETNVRAHRMYAKLGFVERQRRPVIVVERNR